jgi:hypothetical protein
MKTLAVSLVLALGLAGPALADPAKPTPPVAAQPSDIAAAPDSANVIDEAAIADATTPEARRALLIRCSGPPPRPVHVARVEAPKAEPVDISLDPASK